MLLSLVMNTFPSVLTNFSLLSTVLCSKIFYCIIHMNTQYFIQRGLNIKNFKVLYSLCIMDRLIIFQENFPNFSEAAWKLHILQLYEALNAILKHQEDNKKVNIVQAVGEDTDSSIQNEGSIHNEEITIKSTPDEGLNHSDGDRVQTGKKNI